MLTNSSIKIPSPFLLRTSFVPSSFPVRSRFGAIERRWKVGNTYKVGKKTSQAALPPPEESSFFALLADFFQVRPAVFRKFALLLYR